jgi:hypothetical protein
MANRKISQLPKDAIKLAASIDLGKRKGKNAPREYGLDQLKAVTTTNGNSSSHA